MKTIKTFLAVAVVLIINAGCAKSLSNNIATGEVFAVFKVEGDSTSKVSCHATFTVGGTTGTFIELVGNDKVYCSDGVQEIELKEDPGIFNIVTYSGTGLTYDPGRTYSMRFTRGSSENYVSSAILPLPVNILSPAPNASAVKGQPLPVAWNSANSDGVRLDLSYSSSTGSGSKSASDNDDGLYTFPGSETNPLGSGSIPSHVSLERYKTGSFSTGLKGGYIEGAQRASVSLNLVD